MFAIEMLPAREGDAIWIEYGDPSDPNRLLIDCGYKSTYRTIMQRVRSDSQLTFELMVLTHIDGDHIAGAVPLIADADITNQRIKEVWFNGRENIEDVLGVRQAEYFTQVLKKKKFNWNQRFGGRAIYVSTDKAHTPIKLNGGMNITLLSPDLFQLEQLSKHWTKELDALLKGEELEDMLVVTPKAMQPDLLGEPDVKQLARTPFQSDVSVPNGSSIAFLAEYDDEYDGDRAKRVIFCGDAHSSVLEKSIELLLAKRGAEQLKIDALKVSHHGSKANTSPDLLKMLHCQNFLFSTNGSRHEHPDPECIARILTTNKLKKNLHFNYRSDENKMWGSRLLARKYDYQAHYPDTEESGILITL